MAKKYGYIPPEISGQSENELPDHKDEMKIENRAFTLGELENLALQASIWKKERQALLEMTAMLDEHPEGYEGPCLCELCRSCA